MVESQSHSDSEQKKQCFITRKKRRGGLGPWGGPGLPPTVETKKELNTTRKDRGERGVSANSESEFIVLRVTIYSDFASPHLQILLLFFSKLSRN